MSGGYANSGSSLWKDLGRGMDESPAFGGQLFFFMLTGVDGWLGRMVDGGGWIQRAGNSQLEGQHRNPRRKRSASFRPPFSSLPLSSSFNVHLLLEDVELEGFSSSPPSTFSYPPQLHTCPHLRIPALSSVAFLFFYPGFCPGSTAASLLSSLLH